VKEFVQWSFEAAGLPDWTKYVRTDAKFERPAEVHTLLGKPAKAEAKLGWKARTHAPELAKLMVAAESR
jgi:GDPmannose 4,6-dehydratase